MFFDTTFTTEAEAIQYIAGDKAEPCATALRIRFEEAIDSGITDLNLAAERAVILHVHLDHQLGLNVPENFPFTNDDETEVHIVNELMSLNSDGRAEERVDLVINLFRLYRSWGVNLYFAVDTAVGQAAERWEKLNPPPDLNEDELLAKFDSVPDPKLVELLREVYTDARKGGESVRDSALLALQAGRFAIQLSTLLGGRADLN